jgi:hypothetical protein
MDGKPRSRKWAHGIKIATEKGEVIKALFFSFLFGYNSSNMIYGLFCLTRDYLKIQTGSFFSISHATVGTMEIGASVQFKFLPNLNTYFVIS